ncbi:hypothetical protein [Streptomyces atratus]|uniref:hypothetical protein n=1 Tax=Streptomyces atratus TaxID=1893 RepID=UPI0033F295BB
MACGACSAGQNVLHRLARCAERRTIVIDAFFDLAGTIVIVGTASSAGHGTLTAGTPPPALNSV